MHSVNTLDPSTHIPLARAVFARRLRELRVPRGFRTARSLARALGIDENRYTRYERAEVEPDLSLLVRICEVLGIAPNDMLAEAMRADGNQDVPGFSEKGAEGPKPQPANNVLRQRTIAWAIARLVVETELDLQGDAGAAAPGLQILQRCSHLHGAIESDPFAFIANLTRDPRFAELPNDAQQRIVHLFDELTETMAQESGAILPR